MTVLRRFARAVRRSRLINPPIASTVRWVSARFPKLDWLAPRWPRIGWFRVRTPGGEPLWVRGRLGDPVSASLYRRGWDGSEPETCRLIWALAGHSSCFIDIGAHVGLYSLLVASRNSATRVVAVEPHPRVYQQLEEHIRINRLAVERMRVAATASRGQRTFYFDGLAEVPSSSGVGAWMATVSNRAEVTVECLTVDDIVQAKGLEPDLMKDVEGTEDEVLVGARMTIERHEPLIIVEVLSELGGEQYDFGARIAGALGKSGYRFLHIGAAGFTEAEVPSGRPDGRNWVLVRRGSHLQMLREFAEHSRLFFRDLR